jgi:hypothetical protein
LSRRLLEMRHFPQLESGCMGQYPVVKRIAPRAAWSETPGGVRRRAFDAAGSRVEWVMELHGLSESEAEAVESLFEECEGRRRSFVFVDPTANLLAATDDMAGTHWEKGPGAVVTGGVTGVNGETGGCVMANLGAGWSGISQAAAIPEEMRYCLSAWLRAPGGGRVRLRVGQTERVVEAGGEWRQEWVSGVSGETGPVEFAIECEAGAAAEVWGPQAEAQGAPSEYKRNRGRGGWYAKARFGEDRLRLEAEGAGVYCGVVVIESPWEE